MSEQRGGCDRNERLRLLVMEGLIIFRLRSSLQLLLLKCMRHLSNQFNQWLNISQKANPASASCYPGVKRLQMLTNPSSQPLACPPDFLHGRVWDLANFISFFFFVRGSHVHQQYQLCGNVWPASWCTASPGGPWIVLRGPPRRVYVRKHACTDRSLEPRDYIHTLPIALPCQPLEAG